MPPSSYGEQTTLSPSHGSYQMICPAVADVTDFLFIPVSAVKGRIEDGDTILMNFLPDCACLG